MTKLQNHCVVPFGFKKGKTEHFSYHLRATFSFLINLLNTGDRKKKKIYFFVDLGWRESRLPSLARVFFLCLVRGGVPLVSWEVGYLNKPFWRAVPIFQIE